MPSNETVKTKSAHRRFWGWALPAAAIIFVFIAAFWQNRAPQVTAHLGNRSYALTRAVSQAQKEKGLSDTAGLKPNHGMLFWDDHTSQQCLWMKDMRYSLDMVWLDAHKKVVHVEQNAAPGSYPKSFCAQAQYIIEINAGEVARSGLKLGQSVTF
jgi:uncharacterized membrane protein (UPF0127 family)